MFYLQYERSCHSLFSLQIQCMHKNLLKLQQVEQRKLKTIQQNKSEQDLTVDRYGATSPIQVIKRRHKASSIGKQSFDIFRESKELSFVGSNRKFKINNINVNNRHRRNKTEIERMNQSRQVNPIYSCLYVPFLQTKGLGFKDDLQTEFKMDYQKSQNKPKQKTTSTSVTAIRPIIINKQRIKNRQKAVSLPHINKQSKIKVNKVQKSTIRNRPVQIKPSFVQGNNIEIIENKKTICAKIEDQAKQKQKSLREFKLENRDKKVSSKKSMNKNDQWKQINFLQLRTSYFQIQNKLANKSLDQLNHKTINYDISKTIKPKNSLFNKVSDQSQVYQRNVRVPKLPSSIQEVSLLIKKYVSQKKIKKVSIDQLMRSKYFSVKYVQKDSLYFGELNNQIQNGYGIIIKNDYLFQGQWKQGHKISGMQAKKGSSYDGDFQHNKKQGFGISYWNNGTDQYSGQWKNGLKHGNGVWKNSKGDQYIGHWINGKVQGYGVHSTTDGQKYQGYFSNFLKHGKGKQIFPNGDMYQGTFSEGKPQGKGTYIFHRCKAKYQGQFRKGLRQGKGKLTAPDNFTYEGDFKQDKVAGQGRIYYINNDNYIGGFKDGLRHGNGSFQNCKQNKIFNGMWKNGLFSQLKDEDPTNKK